MKQILQDLSNGNTSLVEAPTPKVRAGHLLIDTAASLISIGTERMLVDFGRAGFVSKARQQPDKVKQALEKVRTDGIVTTVEAIRAKLAQPIPLGYSNVGVVRESGVDGFAVGDRVLSNGPHADVVCVPRNLCAKIPDGVSDEEAAFAVVASIGLQGIRLANPTLGESIVVTGVGLIGLLVVQMLRAQGCRVLAVDFDSRKLELARQFGAETCHIGAGEDPLDACLAFTRGIGADAVIVAASTKSNDPVTQAARMCRKRGRIILVGVAGLELSRADFYDKELSFQVSCSYGPGRYDAEYEEKGHDYPIAFVRWTEQRNFQAVLDLMASGQLCAAPLITHRYAFSDAPKAYDLLGNDNAALGVILEYGHSAADRHLAKVILKDHVAGEAAGELGIALIGAGNYASRMLIPAFKAAGAHLKTIVSASGTSAVVHGRSGGFDEASADYRLALDDPDIGAVAIATRHNSHARLVCEALDAGKHVFVEKPLALSKEELSQVEAAYRSTDGLLMVGFNRRFAPQITTMKKLIDAVHEPKTFVMLMNAGAIPADHWTQDRLVGGGRIIGEACHYIDLMRFLAGAPIVSVSAGRIGGNGPAAILHDKAAITLGFADGSFGTIHYLANGGSSFPKERIEVFAAGRTLQLENFIKLRGFNWPGFHKQNLWRQDKGQANCIAAFMAAIRSGAASPIGADELFEVARVTIEAAELIAGEG
jgi:predicted dehydrogenase